MLFRSGFLQPALDDVPVDLDCSGLRLTGTVRLRGDELVVISPSDLPRPLFEPWVQLLALAASGFRTRARIHHLRRHYGEFFPGSVTLNPPQEAAATWRFWCEAPA